MLHLSKGAAIMRKTVLIIIATIIVLFGVTYSIILHDTDSVLNDFINCIKCNTASDTVADTELYRYYSRNEMFDNEIYDANVNVRRLFVIHNFHKGVMFIKYDCETFNGSGEHVYGSSDVYAKWYIEKKDGIWVVTDVIEKP